MADNDTEQTASCARCGSSADWDQCTNCGGEGVDGHDCGEDCCACLDPEDNVPCQYCRGEGGGYCCLSSDAWCEANPLPGCENIEGGTVKWSELPGMTAAGKDGE